MTIIFFSGNLHKAREISAIFANAEVRIYTEFMEKFEVVESGASFAKNAKIKLNALKSAFESQIDSNEKLRDLMGENIILMAEDSGICVESLYNLPNIFSARFANLPPLPLKNGESLEAIHSADSSDSENIMRLISELKARKLSESRAKFVSCVACCVANLSLRDSQCESKQSTLCRHTEQSEVSKTRESSTPNESITKNRINDLDSPLQHCDSSDSMPCDLDSSLISFAQNDGFEKNAESNQILTTHGFLNGKVICKIRGQNGFGYDPIFIPNGFDKTLAELPSEVKNALSHRRNALDLMQLLLK